MYPLINIPCHEKYGRIERLFGCVNYISTKNILAVKKEQPRAKKGLGKRDVKSKMGCQGLCSVTADGNKILIITSQAAKH